MCVYTHTHTYAAVQLLQSHLTLCNPMDCSPPGSSVHGILQARIWSGLSCSPPEDLPNSGIGPGSPASQADSLPLSYQGSPYIYEYVHIYIGKRNGNSLQYSCLENPWTGGLQSLGSQRVQDTTEQLSTHIYIYI